MFLNNLMEPIEVTAHFDEQGTVTPLHFNWKGGRYRVESSGRRWTDGVGQHILVMVTNGRIYELIYQGGEGRWFISQSKPEAAVI